MKMIPPYNKQFTREGSHLPTYSSRKLSVPYTPRQHLIVLLDSTFKKPIDPSFIRE